MPAGCYSQQPIFRPFATAPPPGFYATFIARAHSALLGLFQTAVYLPGLAIHLADFIGFRLALFVSRIIRGTCIHHSGSSIVPPIASSTGLRAGLQPFFSHRPHSPPPAPLLLALRLATPARRAPLHRGRAYRASTGRRRFGFRATGHRRAQATGTRQRRQRAGSDVARACHRSGNRQSRPGRSSQPAPGRERRQLHAGWPRIHPATGLRLPPPGRHYFATSQRSPGNSGSRF